MTYYLLIGYGVSNRYVAQFLNKRRKKYIIYKNFLIIPWDKIKYGIISPGIKPTDQIVKTLEEKKIKIITDMDLLYLYNQQKKIKSIYVGITGSNGKTSTSQMISSFLDIPHLLCGNIGLSIFQNFKKYKNYKIYIIEVSSYQLHYIQYMKFHISLITNITPNHDEWHGGFEEYKNTKLKIKKSNKMENLHNWSVKHNILTYKNIEQYRIKNPLFFLKHNKENLIQSLEIIEEIYYTFSIKNITQNINYEKIEIFKTDKYRQHITYKKDNTIIINDSKSTNISSTVSCLHNYIGRKFTLIIGGLIKGDINHLREYLEQIDRIIIYGPNSNVLKNILQEEKYTNYIIYTSLREYLGDIKTIDQTILFSPGGASFDEFTNYKDRGKYFDKIVLKKLLI